ncbi:MAG: SDR family oxidoreductase [Candidatus Microthrix sp.]|nr:SDR family oxidoreductase [Candidatus Microthrix sp.]
MHGCHYFLPTLCKADEAHIVNMSSMVAFVGLPQNAAYALSKGAVRSFTEAISGELAASTVGVTAAFPPDPHQHHVCRPS